MPVPCSSIRCGMCIGWCICASNSSMFTAGSRTIHTATMQAIDTEMCVIKRQSMDRRCDVLLRLHQHSGCDSVSLNYDTLRKRLSDVVREFGYLLAAHADFQSLGATEYPQGLLSACGGCWRASQPSPVVSTSAGLHMTSPVHVHAP